MKRKSTTIKAILAFSVLNLSIFNGYSQTVQQLNNGTATETSIRYTNSNSSSNGSLSIGIEGNTNAFIKQFENRPLLFHTNTTGSNNERMRITESGRVGIGEVAPNTLLDIGGDLRIQTVPNGPSLDKVLVVDATGKVHFRDDVIGSGSGGPDNDWTVTSNGVFMHTTDFNNNIGIGHVGLSNTKLFVRNLAATNVNIASFVRDNGVATMVVKNSGFVNIGERLLVGASGSTVVSANPGAHLQVRSQNPSLSLVTIGTSAATAMRIDATGNTLFDPSLQGLNVTIGRATPQPNSMFAVSNPVNNIYLARFLPNNSVADPVHTGGVGAMDVLGSGHVIIGNNFGAPPKGKFQIRANNSVSAADGFSNSMVIETPVASNAANVNFLIKNDGGVGITDAGAPTALAPYVNNNLGFALRVFGEAYLSTGNLWVSSDGRFKKNITEIKSATEKLSQLNGYSYDFNQEMYSNLNFASGKHYGVLAQELEGVFPELVKTQNDGLKAVNYQGLIPVLITALKEQQAEIEQLKVALQQKNDVNTLREELNELKKSLDQFTSQTEFELTENKQKIVLNQNEPNPFREQTTIRYQLPNNVENAKIVIYSLNGSMIQEKPIEGGIGKINVYANTLKDGIYTYSIFVGEELKVTKKMIIAE